MHRNTLIQLTFKSTKEGRAVKFQKMLLYLCLILIHTAYSKSGGMEFTINGGGRYDADKLVMDLHVEASNKTTELKPIMTTVVPITESKLTSPAVSTAVTTPAPATPPISPISGLKTTAVPPTNVASSTVGTTMSAKKSTTSAVGSTAATTPSEAPIITIATPAPEFNDHLNSRLPGIFSDIERTALQLHNYYRSIHAAPLLTLDFKLRKDAQDYAAKVAKNQLLRPEQDFVLTSKNEGENLGFRCSLTRPDPGKALRQIMKRWYDEGCKYDFRAPPTDKYSYRHFTQLTWRGSRKLGVGISFGRINNLQCLYYVARYSPRGNMGNTLAYLGNVRKGVFDKHFCKPVQNNILSQEVVLKA